MIPYAILSGKLFWKDSALPPLEIRILDLSIDGFTFRVSKKYNVLGKVQAIRLSFFQFDSTDYVSITLSNERSEFELTIEEENDFFYLYRTYCDSVSCDDICCDNMSYRKCAEKLMKEYMHYIDLKLAGDDSELSQQLVGYNKAGESIYPDSAVDWKKQLLERAKNNYDSCKDKSAYDNLFAAQDVELAVELNSWELQQHFLNLNIDDFSAYYFKEQGLEWHPLSKQKIRCVYIGSQYCLHLFPNDSLLISLLERACSLEIHPVLAFPPIKESQRKEVDSILASVFNYYIQNEHLFSKRKLEFIINDWGMLQMLSKKYTGHFDLTLGTLLNKRRKDTRMSYKNGFEKQVSFLSENASNAPFFETYLSEHFAVQRYSCESCGYTYLSPTKNYALHLPFYQTNTASNCTLHAFCQNGNRGIQVSTRACPQYCKAYAFLYPSMLNLIGSKNSLFGSDEQILWKPAYLQAFFKKNLDRIVLSFL